MKTFLLETEIVNYTEEAISIKHFDFPINSEWFRLHYHDRIEFMRIKKGKMHIHLGTEHYVLCENELIIIPPKTLSHTNP